MSVIIIDYGAGNIDSVLKAVKNCGFEAKLSSDPKDLETCSHIILPGVGSFDTAYEGLKATSLIPIIKEQVLEYNIPLLGICVGMQLLATYGDEGEGSEGLDLIPGRVSIIDKSGSVKLPHVGWNDISYLKSNELFDDIPEGKDFYFVHSYCFACEDQDDVVAMVDYNDGITAAICRRNVYGVQFHPEKSQKVGAALLKNFLEI